MLGTGRRESEGTRMRIPVAAATLGLAVAAAVPSARAHHSPAMFDQGRTIAEGPPAAIRADAAVQQLYLREDATDPTDPTDDEGEPTDAPR